MLHVGAPQGAIPFPHRVGAPQGAKIAKVRADARTTRKIFRALRRSYRGVVAVGVRAVDLTAG